MKKSLLAALMMPFFLAGCGGNDASSTTKLKAEVVVVNGALTGVLPRNRADYTIAATASGYTATDNVGGAGVTTFTAVQRLEFADTGLAFDTSGNAGRAYRIYQAAFNRVPDLSGLGYWINKSDRGLGLQDVAWNFVNSAEFRTLYGSNSSDSEFVTLLYQNVLHRAPEQVGFDYWMGILASGRAGRSQVLVEFSESPENTTQVSAAIAAGIAYTPYVRTPTEIRFAPYVDVSYGLNLGTWATSTGKHFVSLAFFNSAGGCNGSWPTAEAGLITSAQALRALGGQVIVSSGGWNANDLAETCANSATLAATYEAVLTRLGTNYLDIDPEHGDVHNNLSTTTVDHRSAALKLLQDSFAAQGKTLHISFTLGVGPAAGLNAENLYVLQSAKAAGVNFDVVNPMIMDYYDGVSGAQMGARSVLALQKVKAQLATLLPGRTDAQYWRMMAATAMIGQNDDPTEVFTLADAQTVLDFARTQGMARLSFWSLSRDNGGCAGSTTASGSCSGVTQSTWAFSNLFGAY